MKFAGFIILAVLLAAGCEQRRGTAQNSDAVATVDGRPILRKDFERALAQSGKTDPQTVLEELVQRQKLLAQARRTGLAQEPDVQRAIENILIARLKDRELEPRLKSARVANESLAQPFESEKPAAQVRLAMLRLQVHTKGSAAKFAETEARLNVARAKAPGIPIADGFGTLGVENSDDDATRLRGGDIGWFEESTEKYNIDAEVLKAGFALKTPGEVSPVIHGMDGLYIVRLLGRRQTQPNTATAQRNVARHRQQLETRKRIEQDFLEEIRRLIPSTINRNALKEVSQAHSLASTALDRASESSSLPAIPR
jgi:hypothetical protein